LRPGRVERGRAPAPDGGRSPTHPVGHAERAACHRNRAGRPGQRALVCSGRTERRFQLGLRGQGLGPVDGSHPELIANHPAIQTLQALTTTTSSRSSAAFALSRGRMVETWGGSGAGRRLPGGVQSGRSPRRGRASSGITRVYDWAAGRVLSTLPGDAQVLGSPSARTGDAFATAGGPVRVWTGAGGARVGRPLSRPGCDERRVESGRQTARRCWRRGTVRVWTLETGRCWRPSTIHHVPNRRSSALMGTWWRARVPAPSGFGV